MFQWLFGDGKKRATDRSERNAVIRRIVTAAANTTPKPKSAEPAGEVLGPFTVSADNPADGGGLARDKVAERAYDIWVRNGRPTGTAEHDWQQAVRELAAEQAPQPTAVS
jgi:hypothetical protein